jgi:hypothetical protein
MACVGCSVAAFETLEDAAGNYGIPLHELTEDIIERITSQEDQTK